MTACTDIKKWIGFTQEESTPETLRDVQVSSIGTDTFPETDGSVETSPFTEDETAPSTEMGETAPSIEKLLQTALLPVGSTMYVWGGGWNEEDTGAGVGATTIGLYPQWAFFAGQQDENYVAREHRYEILNGLDCSGYIGWLVYNLFEQESGKEGYVFKSTETAKHYSELGWGAYLENPEEFVAGDIVSMKGHVWLCLGMCQDGSAVLLHASPPGVSLCGTLTEDGQESSASELAGKYMEEYYPDWQAKYPNRGVRDSYLSEVTVMRWSGDVLPDAVQWQALTAQEVLERLFE